MVKRRHVRLLTCRLLNRADMLSAEQLLLHDCAKRCGTPGVFLSPLGKLLIAHTRDANERPRRDRPSRGFQNLLTEIRAGGCERPGGACTDTHRQDEEAEQGRFESTCVALIRSAHDRLRPHTGNIG